MTPAAVDLSMHIRAEIESRQKEVDLAQRRFMLVDPGNRMVADTLEADLNEKLRALTTARDDYEHARQGDERLLGKAVWDPDSWR